MEEKFPNTSPIEPKKAQSEKKSSALTWQIVSAVLAVALVVSIFTGGFSFETPSGAAVADDVATSKVKFTVLTENDKCTTCDTTRIVEVTKQLFPGITVEEIDYNTKEGKDLYEEYSIVYLPAYLFSANVADEPNYAQAASALMKVDDVYMIVPEASASTYDPFGEVCTNGKDDNDDGYVDCADPKCKESFECRPEKKKRLDVFVMSQCPFGTKALDAMEEVLDNFGDDIDFHINYIANELEDGTFRSLHGQPEVDENIRELCAIEHYPDNYEYMDYIWCRNKDITSSDWEECAEEAFGEVDVIKDCFEGDEGASLLSESIKLANDLGIGASPTWLANNQKEFSGITAEAVKTNYCAANPKLDGCDATLSNDATTSGSCN